jgi:hypothetical protein
MESRVNQERASNNKTSSVILIHQTQITRIVHVAHQLRGVEDMQVVVILKNKTHLQRVIHISIETEATMYPTNNSQMISSHQ